MINKICSRCKIEKSIDNFNKRLSRKSGLASSCKTCMKDYRKDKKLKIQLQQKEYKRLNKENIKRKANVYNIKYYKSNKLLILKNKKQYYKDNRESILKKKKENRHVSNKRESYRKKIDPAYKLRRNLSTTIFLALKKSSSSKNNNSIIQYLPFTIKDLKCHLESRFESWMSWYNWGKYNIKTWDDNDQSTWTWQIDHIIPQSKLPYTSMEDENFKKCWALDNLRPLSAKTNIIEGCSRVRH